MRIILATIVVALGASALGATPCADLASIRLTVEAACPCADQASAGTYKSCVKAKLKADGVRGSCKKQMTKTAKQSVCGKSGVVVCCQPGKKGKVVKSSKCKGEACASGPGNGFSVFPLTGADCSTSGACPITEPTTTTTTAPPTTTTAPPTTSTTVTTGSTTTTTAPPGSPELSIDDVSVTEGDAGTSTVMFTVTQSAPSANVTTVGYATADGTAASPEDYLAGSGTAQITAGNTTAEISVTLNGDTLAEGDESLLVRLSNAVNATITDDEGSAEIVNDDGGAPTTFELIEQALLDGLIDDETALTYKVFSEFQDARLPAEYQGRDEAFFEGIAIMDAARRFDTLTPATQAIMAPFLEFPDLPAPALQRAPEEHVRSSGVAVDATPAAAVENLVSLVLLEDKITLLWDANSASAVALAAAANRLKAEFDARIRAKMTAFLGMPAAGEVRVVLTDTPGGSFEDVNAECTIAQITLRQFHPWVFVHELTHALLDLNYEIAACNQPEKQWMHEATAHWAQHYVYPPADQGREQTGATWFLDQPERSLSAYDKSPRGHEYGAYLWFLRLAGQENNPDVVRDIWASGAGVSSLEAIEAVLQGSGLGGFADQWPKFALDNWNRLASEDGPYRKYHQWDKLNHDARQQDHEVRLDGAGWGSEPLVYDLPILAADYHRYDFTKDPDVRGILVINDDAGNDPNASIWAIVKIKDQPWAAAEDWSNEKEKFFCRDKADQDVEEIIVVVSNRAFQPGTRIQNQGNFAINYTALPCNDWTGSTTFRRDGPATGWITSAEGEGLRFRVDLKDPLGFYKAIEGAITVHINETFPYEDGTCTSTASASADAKDHGHFTMLWLGGSSLQFRGEEDPFDPPVPITVTTECVSSSGTETFIQVTEFSFLDWFYTGSELRPIDFGATTITGSHSAVDVEDDLEWTWNFVKDP